MPPDRQKNARRNPVRQRRASLGHRAARVQCGTRMMAPRRESRRITKPRSEVLHQPLVRDPGDEAVSLVDASPTVVLEREGAGNFGGLGRMEWLRTARSLISSVTLRR
jgi:hypothetical protein